MAVSFAPYMYLTNSTNAGNKALFILVETGSEKRLVPDESNSNVIRDIWRVFTYNILSNGDYPEIKKDSIEITPAGELGVEVVIVDRTGSNSICKLRMEYNDADIETGTAVNPHNQCIVLHAPYVYVEKSQDSFSPKILFPEKDLQLKLDGEMSVQVGPMGMSFLHLEPKNSAPNNLVFRENFSANSFVINDPFKVGYFHAETLIYVEPITNDPKRRTTVRNRSFDGMYPS